VSARTRLATALVLAGLVAACGAQPPAGSASAVPTGTAPVIRTDITSTRQVPGTLMYSGSYTLTNQQAGIYTALPTPGAVITRGQVLYRINDRPVVLMYGSPEWRSLGVGVTDGPDVRQLEENLLALGYATNANLVANGHFDAFDAAAVRRWQASLGVPRTGQIAFGDIVYTPGPLRITTVEGALGTPAGPGSPFAQATGTQHVIVVQLDVNDQSEVHAGDAVSVQLPDGSRAAGTVSSIGTVAVQVPSSGPGPAGGGPSATVTVTVALSDPNAGGHLDQAPVIVDIADAVHKGVLAAPVMALLAQPGGAFGVEVVEGSQRRLVTVTTGLFDDRGLVEVSSPDLQEGMQVEVPQQ
jgi:peptidoglycan hydrolase-like protein with peptidoglycan-binding domain